MLHKLKIQGINTKRTPVGSPPSQQTQTFNPVPSLPSSRLLSSPVTRSGVSNFVFPFLYCFTTYVLSSCMWSCCYPFLSDTLSHLFGFLCKLRCRGLSTLCSVTATRPVRADLILWVVFICRRAVLLHGPQSCLFFLSILLPMDHSLISVQNLYIIEIKVYIF